MKKILMVVFTLTLTLCFSLGDLSLVMAQETQAEEFTLEEITVTAQKREQDLQKVATGVEVIQGYQLTEMGLVDLDEALRNVASALVQHVGEEMTVIIRGMDNDSMPGDSFSQVAVTVDGSFSNSWGVGTTGLYDMQRVEVLAGPQGTLYSRNSSGGVVNMISNNPTTEEVQASGSVELGNFNLVNTQGVLNVPISDAWALRAAFISTKRTGYSDNGLNDTDDRSLRLKLGFTPTDAISAVLTYEYTQLGGKSQGDGYAAFEDQDDVDDPWHSNSNGDLFVNDTQTDRFYLNFDWITPIGTLTFLPSYSDTSRHNIQAGWLWSNGNFGMMGGPGAVHAGQGREHFVSPQDESSYELRMASPDEFFMKYVVGLYYYEREWRDLIYHEDAAWEYEGTTFFSASTKDTANWGTKGSSSSAAFGNFTLPLTDAFRATAGGRYTKEEETSKGVDRMTGAPTSSKDDSSHFDYKLSLEYDLSTNTMLWVDYSTGYKQVRGASADQELKSYQVGSKSRFLDNKMQMNATAFYYDYSNFDIGRVGSIYVPYDPDTGAWDPEGTESATFNGQGIGDAALYGLDFSADYVITGKDRINMSLSYLSAEVDQVVITYTYQGIEYPDLVPSQIVDKGKSLNNAPEVSLVVGYEHRFDLANGGKITPRFDLRYTSKYYLEFYPDASNIPAGMDVDKVNTEPSHMMADASLNYSNAGGKWTLNGYVKNIMNYAEKNGLMRGDMRLGPPRTFGAVLSVRF